MPISRASARRLMKPPRLARKTPLEKPIRSRACAREKRKRGRQVLMRPEQDELRPGVAELLRDERPDARAPRAQDDAEHATDEDGHVPGRRAP